MKQRRVKYDGPGFIAVDGKTYTDDSVAFMVNSYRELTEAAADYARLIQVEHFDRNDVAVHAAYERLRKATTP